MVITSVINRNIHWVALLRFFKASDSIFNNNKNVVLCNLTAAVLKNLECFPIEGTKDNPKANNIITLCDINAFLNAKSNLGIFPEGTTRREEGKVFGTFSDSFIDIATWHNSWIQPVTIYWNDNKIFRNKVIVNFDKAFMVDQTDKERAMKKFMEIQQKNLYECQLLAGNE